ncbi:hypothetical protein [Ferrimonas aestuarii]|uniref:DUF8180 domain-containing protein n=1 Tax=Ferrimonas aestuarii TaxID=2569539 RepID=A0A4U1BRS5_9GAMM|nr:hypothetical protein [Ferrimonas aestuarii]TKB58377.1 hypothetical protein FCL42_01105 [Ferrimonas aestuarii]
MKPAQQQLIERIRTLLPHWEEHNQAHILEMERWREQLIQHELAELADSLLEVVEQMRGTSDALNQALSQVPEQSQQ